MQNHLNKILVTGANGYIASHCIKVLLEKGFQVKGSVRDLKQIDKIKKFILEPFNNGKLEFCELNLFSYN